MEMFERMHGYFELLVSEKEDSKQVMLLNRVTLLMTKIENRKKVFATEASTDNADILDLLSDHISRLAIIK